MVAGVGLGNMTQNLLGLSIILGFNSTIDTLVSQAAGAGDKKLCGVILNRGRFVMSILFIPIIVIMLNAKNILVAVNMDPKVASYAQQYVLAFLPGLYIQGHADLQRRFLNSFGKNMVTFVCTAISIAFHVVWSHIFVIKLGYGIVGTGIANLITCSITFALLLIYTKTQEDIQDAI